ncbi:MAG: leucine-rich repeat domain-containing protein [Candidatus Parcubacteria bacterium]|nr:leucine-rich repeat domain-containing protein [Candidatus Parcubacteria bacterium]
MNKMSMSRKAGSALGGKKLFLIAFVALLLGGCSLLGQPSVTTNTNTPAVNEAPTIPATNKLDLSNQNLTKVPDYVFNLTNLQELNLSNNKLTGAIQSQIGQLKKLKVLNASNNLMTGIPAEVGQLTNLQILDLSNNQLTGLPNELGNLKNLQTFNISGNNYSTQDLNGIMQKLPASVSIIK